MIKITNVTIKNFLSVGNATQAIKLDQNGLTLILGANTDSNGGTTRNGAGKSTILQAISFGLFGKPLTKIKADNLVNNINQKGMTVTVEFEKAGTTYRIVRGRKPQVLRYFVNDAERKEEQDEAQGENRHTQEDIERVLGMTHTMFLHVLALNTFTDPFLKLRAADQRAVIEELLGVMTLSLRADALKKLGSQTKEAVRDQEATIKATTEANSRIEAMIARAVTAGERFERDRTSTLAELNEGLRALANIDFDAEIAAFDALDAFMTERRAAQTVYDRAEIAVNGVNRDLADLDREITREGKILAGLDAKPVIARLNQEIDRKAADQVRHQAQQEKLQDQIAKTEASIAGSDSQICVCCHQPLTGTDHLATVIANLEAEAATLRKRATREETEAANRAAEIEELRAEITATGTRVAEEAAVHEAQITTLRAARDETAERRETLLTERADALASLRGYGTAPETLFQSRDELYKAKQMHETLARDIEAEVARVNPHTGQIDELRLGIQPIDGQPLKDLQDLQKHQELLLKLLTNKDSFIRKKIVDQNLNYLNQRLNHYLDKLGLPHEVRFQPDLSVDIQHLGRDFDFEQLSRGEMNRVIMATSWSFRDVWESLNEPVNLYFIDEVLDQGTDSHGAEAALGILKGMARDRGKNVFLISHRDELVGRIDRTLLVRKEQGFSMFEEDAL